MMRNMDVRGEIRSLYIGEHCLQALTDDGKQSQGESYSIESWDFPNMGDAAFLTVLAAIVNI